jgi:MFS family permease
VTTPEAPVGARLRRARAPRRFQPSERLRAARRDVSLTFFLNGALGATWASRLPLIKQQAHLSDGRLSLALLALPVGVIIATRLVASLGRYVSTSGQIRLGIAGVSGMLVLLGVARTLGGLCAVLFALGFCNGIWDVSMNTQAVGVERGYRRPVMASMHGAFSIGVLAGALVGAVAARANIAPVLHFAGVAVLLTATATLGMKALLDDDATAESERAHGHGAPHADAVRNGPTAINLIGLIIFCSFFAEGAVDNWSAVFLHQVRGASLGLAPLGASLCGAGMAVARFRGDVVIRRVGRRATLLGASVVGCAGLTLAATMPTLALALVGFAVFGVGAAAIAPVAFTLAGDVGGARPEWAVARVAAFGYAGLLSSPAAIGQIAGRLGFVVAFLIPAALLLVVVPASTVVSRAEPGTS